MKLRLSGQSNLGFTLLEVAIVIFVLLLLAAMLMPARNHPHKAMRISCVNNIKQIGLAYRVWAGDNNDKYPMDVSVTNGGAMELIAAGNVLDTYRCMSNELSTPKILYCPANHERNLTTDFGTNFTAINISYFISVVANESNPQGFLCGDDNFQRDGSTIGRGLNDISTNDKIYWPDNRHVESKKFLGITTQRRIFGNIGFADGSALELNSVQLQQALKQTGLATNHLAIP